MGFVDQHALRETRAHLLERQGKYWAAFKQWFEDGLVSTAFDVHLRHLDHTCRDPSIMNAITKFLWRYLSFGCYTWPNSAGVRVNKIITLLDAISKQKLGGREQNMASVSNMLLATRADLDRIDRCLQACLEETEIADLREWSRQYSSPSRP